MKTKLLFLLPMLAVLAAGCEKKSDNASEEKNVSVETVSATNITSNSALLTGKISVEITDYKSVEFGMLVSPKESDVSSYEGKEFIGSKLISQTFSVTAQNLSAETQYYYRAYLVLNNTQYEYGDVKSFKTEKASGGGGKENNHEYVDLGLSVKWATCNVGATKPEGYGDFFAWGETSPKSVYYLDTYKWCNGSDYEYTKYCTNSNYGTVDNKTILEPADDVAHVKWGGKWRMPTYNELNELKTQCTWTWTRLNGFNGYEVIGKNGNSIFLPAAGYRTLDIRYDVESYGYYWSSELRTYYSYNANNLNFMSPPYVYMDYSSRYNGLSVRPVCP